MKNIIKKLERNKLIFALFMMFLMFSFMFITNGLHGIIVKDWNGLNKYLEGLRSTTYSGRQTFYEVIWIIFLIPVLLIFNNKYIFTEKKASFKDTIKIIWPMLLLTSAVGFMMFQASGGFKYFNVDEVVASIFLYSLVGIFEEFLCRGWLQNEFIERFGNTRGGVIYSIVLSGLIFGSIHIMNFFGGQALGSTLIQITSAAIAGIYFGAVYFKTKNIWVTVILHAFWDLCISFGMMNETITCAVVQNLSPMLTLISGTIVILMLDTPEVFISLKLLTKTSVNEVLGNETDELQKNKDNRKSKIFNIITIIYVLIISGLLALLGLILLIGNPTDSCLNYETVYRENPIVTTINYKEYNLNIKKELEVDCIIACDIDTMIYDYNLYFKLDDRKLLLVQDNKEYTFDIDNVIKFAIYQKDNKYILMVLTEEDSKGLVYYSDYLSDDTINDNVFDKLNDSLNQLELPSIKEFGYYGDTKDPLFKTPYGGNYIMIDGDIKKLEIK